MSHQSANVFIIAGSLNSPFLLATRSALVILIERVQALRILLRGFERRLVRSLGFEGVDFLVRRIELLLRDLDERTDLVSSSRGGTTPSEERGVRMVRARYLRSRPAFPLPSNFGPLRDGSATGEQLQLLVKACLEWSLPIFLSLMLNCFMVLTCACIAALSAPFNPFIWPCSTLSWFADAFLALTELL